jgi:hypothetical protein
MVFFIWCGEKKRAVNVKLISMDEGYEGAYVLLEKTSNRILEEMGQIEGALGQDNRLYNVVLRDKKLYFTRGDSI